MKLLIVSDTHGRESALKQALQRTGPIERLIHLGDVEGGADRIRALAGVPTDLIAGNNDAYCGLPGELTVEIGGYRAWLTHGHRYAVYAGTDGLAREAERRGVDIVMYGHTHQPRLEYRQGMTILNPGSLSLPRQENHRPSYIVMELDREGEAHYTICYL